MRLGVLAILLTAAAAAPAAHAESECEEYKGADTVQLIEPRYKLIEPLDHSITSGTFLSLCAEPDHLWYVIELDTHQPGNLTITIPKDSLDLRQYDYESCYLAPYYFKNLRQNDIVSVRQISETDTSQTLKFTYEKPVPRIEYLGSHFVIDGSEYSEPSLCVELVERGARSSDLPALNPDHVPGCTVQVQYDYEISGGRVEKICRQSSVYEGGYGPGHDHDDRPLLDMVTVFLKDVDSYGRLAVDIPYADMPLVNEDTWRDIDLDIDGHNVVHPEMLFQTTTPYANYQTFNIGLTSDTRHIELLNMNPLILGKKPDPGFYSCGSGFVSVMKHDRSDLACVTPATAETLVARGWALPF